MARDGTGGRIALLLPGLRFGGAERVALTLAEALAAEGFEIDLLLMSRQGEFLDEAESQFNVIDLRCGRTWKLPWKLAGYLRAQRPTALISSFWKLNLCACIARVTAPRTRLLLWEHSQPSLSANSPTWLYAITASIIYRMATRIVAVSSGVRDDIASITLGLGRKLQVVMNPIRPPADLPDDASRPRDGSRLLWVGRMDGPKNPQLALEAFALLAARRDATLTFMGDGDLMAGLMECSDRLGLGGRVSFTGFHPRPYELMPHADVLVLSSEREGLGNVIIEAMFCGLGIVATDCGQGVRDLLMDGRYGTIASGRDPASLADAIEYELCAGRDPRVQMDGARRFLPSRAAGQFLEIVQG